MAMSSHAGIAEPENPGSASTQGRRVYAIGDVHGRFDLLMALLEQIDADRRAHDSDDEPVLIFCGDYIDRGPQSAEVVEALCWLRDHGPFELVLLKGNHEQGLLRFLDDPESGAAWISFGGDATLASYGTTAPGLVADKADLIRTREALMANLPARHLELLNNLAPFHTVGGYVFVHAGLRPGRRLAEQTEDDMLWIRREFLEADGGFEHIVVHGHSWFGPQPQIAPGRIGLDTGAYETGVLTAVLLDDEAVSFLQARSASARAPAIPPLGPLRPREATPFPGDDDFEALSL